MSPSRFVLFEPNRPGERASKDRSLDNSKEQNNNSEDELASDREELLRLASGMALFTSRYTLVRIDSDVVERTVE